MIRGGSAPLSPKVTAAALAAQVAAYLKANPPANGQNATPELIRAAVDAYFAANPPAAGQNATSSQIATAVADYLRANPPAAGRDATPQQIATSVAAYLQANPPAAGQNATPEQIASAVASYLQVNPPPAGKSAPVPSLAVCAVSGSGVLTSALLQGFGTVTRVSAGRYRFNFSPAQPDLLYVPREAILDTARKISRLSARTTAFVEVQVEAINVSGTSASFANADASEVFLSVDRKA